MIKRTIYIGNPTYLKSKNNQLEVIDPTTNEVKGKIPIEDIALLVLDNYQITLSSQIITQLLQNNSAILHCNSQHLPQGLMLPFEGNTLLSENSKYQINASEPLKKQLWKQTIESKIKNQQLMLSFANKNFIGLNPYLNNVKSGDTTNMEGVAANYYWKELFHDFKRNRFGNSPNNMLNYGYIVLRSIVARAIVSSGLLPLLGIYHKNKYNAYCLADDIMEPYRPFVDKMVYHYLNNTEFTPHETLTKKTKAYLLQIATQDVLIKNQKSPLMVAVSTTTASLVKCYKGELKKLNYPVLI